MNKERKRKKNMSWTEMYHKKKKKKKKGKETY
jgi:hypothetical protein